MTSLVKHATGEPARRPSGQSRTARGMQVEAVLVRRGRLSGTDGARICRARESGKAQTLSAGATAQLPRIGPDATAKPGACGRTSRSEFKKLGSSGADAARACRHGSDLGFLEHDSLLSGENNCLKVLSSIVYSYTILLAFRRGFGRAPAPEDPPSAQTAAARAGASEDARSARTRNRLNGAATRVAENACSAPAPKAPY